MISRFSSFHLLAILSLFSFFQTAALKAMMEPEDDLSKKEIIVGKIGIPSDELPHRPTHVTLEFPGTTEDSKKIPLIIGTGNSDQNLTTWKTLLGTKGDFLFIFDKAYKELTEPTPPSLTKKEND